MRDLDFAAEELRDLAQRIADNIARNGQKASGKTAESLEVVEGSDSVTLVGRKYFDNLERGVPPWSSINKKKVRSFGYILYQWSQDKGLTFADEDERKSFAFALAYKIANHGTELFREGGRADVYSSEIPDTIKRIIERMQNTYLAKIESIPLNLGNNESSN